MFSRVHKKERRFHAGLWQNIDEWDVVSDVYSVSIKGSWAHMNAYVCHLQGLCLYKIILLKRWSCDNWRALEWFETESGLQPCCNVTLHLRIRLGFQNYLYLNSVWIGPTAPASGSQGRPLWFTHHLNWVFFALNVNFFILELFTVESAAVFEVNLFYWYSVIVS